MEKQSYKKSILTFTVCLFLCVGITFLLEAEEVWAFVKVPSTDLCLKRLSSFNKFSCPYYNSFPCAPDKGYTACLRIHQLKFNELVKVKSSLKEEVECEVPHFFYKGHDKQVYKTFWALKRDFIFLKDIPSKAVLAHIPPPYTVDASSSLTNKNVLTLIAPWFDKSTGITYSAGTRFVRCASKDTAKSYAIFIIECKSLKSTVKHIPRSAAIVEYPKQSSQAAALFVQVLKKWAHARDGIIPYVFGGCSYKRKITPRGFSLISHSRFGEEVSYWQRKDLHPYGLSGFDCSTMILCAAQICGMPYFYKNSFTLYHSLQMLKKHERLQEGDILWYSGHVMVVSDVKRNLLIEAAGYDTGFGRVHEISIDKVFKQIKNYSELIAAYEKEIPLERLHSNGHPIKTVYGLKIFALKSIWRGQKR